MKEGRQTPTESDGLCRGAEGCVSCWSEPDRFRFCVTSVLKSTPLLLFLRFQQLAVKLFVLRDRGRPVETPWLAVIHLSFISSQTSFNECF